MEFKPRLCTIFYRSWARKIEEFKNRYFFVFLSVSHILWICVEYVSLPSKGQESRCRRPDRKLHYLIRVLQSDPAKVTPTRIVLRFDNPSAKLIAGFIERSLSWKLRTDVFTSRRTHHAARKIAPRCNYIRTNWGDLRTRPRYVIQILKFHTHTYTRIRTYTEHTFAR